MTIKVKAMCHFHITSKGGLLFNKLVHDHSLQINGSPVQHSKYVLK